MKQFLFVFVGTFLMLHFGTFAQTDNKDKMPTIDVFLESANKEICACIDSIEIKPNNRQKLRDDIADCIDQRVMTYIDGKKALRSIRC